MKRVQRAAVVLVLCLTSGGCATARDRRMMGYGLLGGGIATLAGASGGLIYGAAKTAGVKGASSSGLAEGFGLMAGISGAIILTGLITVLANGDEAPQSPPVRTTDSNTNALLTDHADYMAATRRRLELVEHKLGLTPRVPRWVAPASQPVPPPVPTKVEPPPRPAGPPVRQMKDRE